MLLPWVASISAGICLLAPVVSHADDGEAYGKELFGRYCGACHGADGTGNGVMSGFLRQKPADLTQIAKENGGSFPFYATLRFIDGTQDVRAHGDPDMPVWGEVLRSESAASPMQQAEIRGKILAITAYVRSIQEE